jgi:hypothetical protein
MPGRDGQKGGLYIRIINPQQFHWDPIGFRKNAGVWEGLLCEARTIQRCEDFVYMSRDSPIIIPASRGTNDQDRIAGMAHHRFGNTAQHPTLYARPPMCAHGDQVVRGFAAQRNDLICTDALL